MPKKSLMKWNCATDVYFYSHTLKRGPLDEWNERVKRDLRSPILLHFVDEHRLKLHFYLPDKVTVENIGIRANMMTISLMIALNLADPGSHIWWPPALWPIKHNIEENWKKIGIILPFKPFADRQYKKFPVDKKMLNRFALIWGASVRIEAIQFFHYVKATNLLSSPSPEVNFYEEIFINFWKAIERFIAVEIKKNRKPVNNIKPIIEAFEAIDSPPEFINEIKELYKLRGSTIAHSYGKEQKVTFEEVGKCKLFADFLMYKHLMARVEKSIKAKRKKKLTEPVLKPSMESSNSKKSRAREKSFDFTQDE